MIGLLVSKSRIIESPEPQGCRRLTASLLKPGRDTLVCQPYDYGLTCAGNSPILRSPTSERSPRWLSTALKM
jgi:hypothetical protein